MDNSKFIITGDDGVSYIATIISNFSLFGDLYCLYNIPKKNEDPRIHVAKIINNNIEEIKDENELKRITEIINKITLEESKKRGK